MSNPRDVALERSVVKAGIALAALALASALPGRAWADPSHANSAAAHFCETAFPPGPDRGRCVQLATEGTGPFFQCGGDPARLCGQQCCSASFFCNPVTNQCENPCGLFFGFACGPVCCREGNPFCASPGLCQQCPEGTRGCQDVCCLPEENVCTTVEDAAGVLHGICSRSD